MQLLFVFLLFACIYSSHTWVLEASHKQVSLGNTKNVSLECKYDHQDNGKPRVAEVFGIIISKFDDSGKWETYAKVRNHQNAVLGDGIGPGVSVKGYADTVQNSFLSMTWSVASANISGSYACEINGYADKDVSVSVITSPVSIKESRLSLDYLLSLFLGLKRQTEQLVNLTQEIAEREITRKDIISIVDTKIRAWQEQEKVQWPGGQYALLNTNEGCPDPRASEWSSGYIRLSSESSHGSNNTDSVSTPSHLAKSAFEKNDTGNFVYMRTCKHELNTTDAVWPKGSYCIHLVGGVCPEGFEYAELDLDTEDDTSGQRDHANNGPDVDIFVSYVRLYFCCREDGEPTTPIRLPVDTPFYLYRYKGTCQEVQSAKVTDEWLQVDTEDSANTDKNKTEIFPDVTFNPARFYLCYYSKC